MIATNSRFAHFHVHGALSIDGLNSPEKLIQRALDVNQSAIALTEHGTMGSMVEFAQVAKKMGIKAIAGCEFYVKVDNSVCHITAVGNGLNGYNNLVKILNAGVYRSAKLGEDFARHPVSLEDIERHNEDVILLTGCPSSPLHPKHSSWSESLSLLSRLRSTYGNRLMIEVMLPTEDEITHYAFERQMKWIKDVPIKIPYLLSNDAHYADVDDRDGHQFIQKSKGLIYDDKQLYIKSREELEEYATSLGLDKSERRIVSKAMENSWHLGRRLDPIIFDAEPTLPERDNADAVLWDRVYSGFEEKRDQYGWDEDYQQEALDLAQEQMEVLSEKGFSNYFLKVIEYIEVGQANGLMGWGRGSAAGSMVAYLTSITNVNPIEHDTIAERFINPLRSSFPDIDIDGSSKATKSMMEYAEVKDNAVRIVTHSYHTEDVLKNDIAKVFGIGEKALKGWKEGDEEVAKAIGREYPKAINAYNSAVNQSIRHAGTHAAGVVLIPPNMKYEIPLTLDGNGDILAEFSEGTHGQYAADAGLVKIDMLNLKTLDAIEIHMEITGMKIPEFGRYEYIEAIPALVDSGNLNGIFQMVGDTASNYAKQFKPTKLEDIVYITSLARTGAIKSGASANYLKYRAKSGHPIIRALKPFKGGDMVRIQLANGVVVHAFKHWDIKLTNKSYMKIADIDDSYDLEIEV